MKNPFLNNSIGFGIGLLLISACNETKQAESSANILENLTFSIDTISVDVGQEVFMAEGYYAFDLSADRSTVYFFYDPDKEIHEIDLKDFSLKSRNKFAQDGPNAVPSFVSDFQTFPSGEFFLGDFMGGGIHSLSGEKLQLVSFQKEDYSGLDSLKVSMIGNSVQFTSDKKMFLSLPVEFGEPLEALAVVNLEQMKAKTYPIPAMDITRKFQVTFQRENSSSSYGDFIQLNQANNLFFLTSSSTSEIYIYEKERDSLRLLSFPHLLVPKQKTGDYITEVDSREKQLEIAKSMSKEISFLDFHWDETRKRYFRFGKMNQEYTEENMPKSADVFLFIYDENLKLLGEKKLEGLDDISYFNFFSGGKFFVYHVTDEVPAFIIIDFEF